LEKARKSKEKQQSKIVREPKVICRNLTTFAANNKLLGAIASTASAAGRGSLCLSNFVITYFICSIILLNLQEIFAYYMNNGYLYAECHINTQ